MNFELTLTDIISLLQFVLADAPKLEEEAKALGAMIYEMLHGLPVSPQSTTMPWPSLKSVIAFFIMISNAFLLSSVRLFALSGSARRSMSKLRIKASFNSLMSNAPTEVLPAPFEPSKRMIIS